MSFDLVEFIREVEKRPPLYDATSEDYSSRATKRRCWSEVGEVLFPDEWAMLTPFGKRTRIKQLIKKWKTLRDNYVREYKHALLVEKGEANPRRKKYTYYDNLQFLQPYVRGKAATNRIENLTCDIDFPVDNEIDEEEQDVHADPLTIPEEMANEEPWMEEPPDLKPDISELNQSQSTNAAPEDTTFLPILCPRQSNTLTVALKSKRTAIKRSVFASFAKNTSDEDVFGHKAFMMSYIPILNSMPLHAAMQARMQISQIVNFAFAENSTQATPTSIRTENSDFN